MSAKRQKQYNVVKMTGEIKHVDPDLGNAMLVADAASWNEETLYVVMEERSETIRAIFHVGIRYDPVRKPDMASPDRKPL